MTKMIPLIFTAVLLASPAAVAMTNCENLAQCRQALQEDIYEHWSDRYSYPGASVILLVDNDLMGNVSVVIESSSGVAAFDQSATQALTRSLQNLNTSQLTEAERDNLRLFRLTLSAE